jgi:hypothetical protein
MNTLNIMGEAERIKGLLSKFGLKPTDVFPAPEGWKDVNVYVDDAEADDLIEWCENNELRCTIV